MTGTNQLLRATRAQLIQELLKGQPAERIEGQRYFIETAGYIKCQHCGTAILKRSNETMHLEQLH